MVLIAGTIKKRRCLSSTGKINHGVIYFSRSSLRRGFSSPQRRTFSAAPLPRKIVFFVGTADEEEVRSREAKPRGNDREKNTPAVYFFTVLETLRPRNVLWIWPKTNPMNSTFPAAVPQQPGTMVEIKTPSVSFFHLRSLFPVEQEKGNDGFSPAVPQQPRNLRERMAEIAAILSTPKWGFSRLLFHSSRETYEKKIHRRCIFFSMVEIK